MMFEFDALKRILTYIAENRLNATLEAEVKYMDVEANEVYMFDVGQRVNIEPKPHDESDSIGMENGGTKGQRLDCTYDDDPLGSKRIP